MANALALETSPYLRQHAENPVDWLPWGELALSRAISQQRPLLVSIGYSSCHWCHVMERESFEDERVAALMNDSFVCVKVDREERPDIDAIYMEAVQAMTGEGGWPLNVFLTPEQMPFYGGTYFPPRPRGGMPSWTQVLSAVAEAWQERPIEISTSAEQLRGRLSGAATLKPSSEPLRESALTDAVGELARTFDSVNGGFGGAPKFPQPTTIELLLGEAALAGSAEAEAMALATLEAIVTGGIHDLLGGGFHRYAVDATWTVPHFEKMLYDNALLARACMRGFVLSGRRELLDASLDTLSWALTEMRGPEGGFHSALDADSEGVEGAFYVWTVTEMQKLLGDDANAAIAWTCASEQGNFVDPHHPAPGRNVLSARGQRPDAQTEQRIRERLLRARKQRARPGLDDKRLTAWNALMISALSEVGACLRYRSTPLDPDEAKERSSELLDAAERCAGFVLGELRGKDGSLLRSWREGRATIGAYLEDHAYLLEALLALYEATFKERWFVEARQIAETMIDRFADEERGGFFSTASDAQPLIARRKDVEDTPIPSGCSSAAVSLLRLAALTGESRYEQHALSTLSLLHEIAPRYPSAFGHLLQALRLEQSKLIEVAIVGRPGPDRDALVRVVQERLRPNVVLAVNDGGCTPTAVPLLQGREPIDGSPAAYVCEHFACKRPVTKPNELRELLR